MTGVRNGSLARIVLNAVGLALVGSVPSGFTWLLKAVHVTNLSGATANAILELSTPAGEVTVHLADLVLEPNASATWAGWTALNPGDRFLVYTDVQPLAVWIAGAELPGVIQP